jgi:hypothetical protein
MKNHFQLLADIPVKRYRHVVNPINGISEKFFRNARVAKTRAMIQKIKVEILNVASSAEKSIFVKSLK